LLAAVDQLAVWATRLYEGKPITAAVGFVPSDAGTGPTISEISDEDFSSVLSNGFDTLLSFDLQGRLFGYQALEQPSTGSRFAPYRQSAIANWAYNGKVALVLNRLGEILILKDGKLLFARRSGRWHFLTHESISAQMGGPQNLELRQAVYESCLDASFARTALNPRCGLPIGETRQ
jgi:hypothetical protein